MMRKQANAAGSPGALLVGVDWLLAGALLAPVSGEALAQEPGQATPIAAAPAFSAQELTALPTDGWITNGGNIHNQPVSRSIRCRLAEP